MLSKFIFGFIVLLFITCILIAILFVYKAQQSKNSSLYTNNLSMGLERLKPCGSKPNCVCSEYADKKQHFIEPLTYEISELAIMEKAVAAINDMQGVIVHQEENYLAVEFSSALLGFVDDFEIRLDATNKTMHFRSASREGHSDFNKNRQRVQTLRPYIL